MRSLRLYSEWPQQHEDFVMKQYRYEVPKGRSYDMYWSDTRKKFFKKPQSVAIIGFKSDVDLKFMENLDWTFVKIFNTSVPHAGGFAFVFAYEMVKDKIWKTKQ